MLQSGKPLILQRRPLWIEFPRITSAEETYLTAIGRALVLAQEFEDFCKHVLIVVEVVRDIKSGKQVDFDYWAKHPEKFVEDSLGKAVRKFGHGNVYQFDLAKVDVLIKAKDARNFIAHEAVRFNVWRENSFRKYLPEFKSKVRDLANGYNLVAGWAYSIEGKEPPPQKIAADFIEEAVQWVMLPINCFKK
jgi:hypothetical protein